jgi:uncharacterized protein
VPPYFVYCRDEPGSGDLRMELLEEHWTYMDGYAAGMIARGPTLTEDGQEATGSLHIVELADAEVARAFAFDEPNYRAGVYSEVVIHRFENSLGRTMWEFTGDQDGVHQLVISHGPDLGDAMPVERLILHGPLLSDDGAKRLGESLAVEGLTRDEVEALVTTERDERVEIHPWRFGGRR